MIYNMKLKKLGIISETFRLKEEISTRELNGFITSVYLVSFTWKKHRSFLNVIFLCFLQPQKGHQVFNFIKELNCTTFKKNRDKEISNEILVHNFYCFNNGC